MSARGGKGEAQELVVSRMHSRVLCGLPQGAFARIFEQAI